MNENLSWPQRLDVIRTRLAKQSGITVIPRGAGLFGALCTGCGNRIIAATGALKDGMCGPCWTSYHAPDPAA